VAPECARCVAVKQASQTTNLLTIATRPVRGVAASAILRPPLRHPPVLATGEMVQDGREQKRCYELDRTASVLGVSSAQGHQLTGRLRRLWAYCPRPTPRDPDDL
jgi:hypothetical protein